jgi:hypothetical protein
VSFGWRMYSGADLSARGEALILKDTWQKNGLTVEHSLSLSIINHYSSSDLVWFAVFPREGSLKPRHYNEPARV